jgi:hypothetical protein
MLDKNEVLRLAKEAGMYRGSDELMHGSEESLERFAALLATPPAQPTAPSLPRVFKVNVRSWLEDGKECIAQPTEQAVSEREELEADLQIVRDYVENSYGDEGARGDALDAMNSVIDRVAALAARSQAAPAVIELNEDEIRTLLCKCYPQWRDLAGFVTFYNALKSLSRPAQSGSAAPAVSDEQIERAAILLHETQVSPRSGRAAIRWDKQLPEYQEHMRNKIRAFLPALLSCPAQDDQSKRIAEARLAGFNECKAAAVKVASDADKSTHPAEIADRILAITPSAPKGEQE